jgi:ribose 1,5-bisphosphokinase PhnN
MLQLTQGLTRLAERGETSAEDVRARLKRDSSLRHSASQLTSESRALSEMGAAALVENLWQSRASIGWARSFIDGSLR